MNTVCVMCLQVMIFVAIAVGYDHSFALTPEPEKAVKPSRRISHDSDYRRFTDLESHPFLVSGFRFDTDEKLS